MLTRIIPRLDIKGPNLVKGVRLEGLRVLGKPEFFARHYYEQGADELLFMDVVASLYERNSLEEIIERTAREIYVPLAVGGGLRGLNDIRKVLRAGADKVSLNTAVVRSPELISEAALRFGSSTIVVSVEAIRRTDGTWEAYTDNGREKTGLNAVEWAIRAAELGAGELIVTSIDREGTGKGFDVELIEGIAPCVNIPVIACGGAGKVADVAEVLRRGADAVAVASLLHYHAIRESDFGSEGVAPTINLAHLQRQGFGRIEDVSLLDLKLYLAAQGYASRPAEGAASNA
jgi:imidazole glycerol-phosphate synthase subunit HisF